MLFGVPLFLPLLFPTAARLSVPAARSSACGAVLGAAVLASVARRGRSLAAAFSPGHAAVFLLLLVLPGLLIAEALARGRGLLRGCGWAFVLVSLQISARARRSGASRWRGASSRRSRSSLARVPGRAEGERPPSRADRRLERADDGPPRRDGRRLPRRSTSSLGGLVVLANAALLRFYLARRDPGWLEGGEFERIRWSLLLAMAFVLAGAAVARRRRSAPPPTTCSWCSRFFFLLQGLAVTAFYAHRLDGPPLLRAMVVVLRPHQPLGAADPGAPRPLRHLDRLPQVGRAAGGEDRDERAREEPSRESSWS